MWARSVIQSSNALHSRALGMTCVHSENGRFVVSATAGLFRSLGHDLEQELGADLGHRHITDFVNGDQIVATPAPSLFAVAVCVWLRPVHSPAQPALVRCYELEDYTTATIELPDRHQIHQVFGARCGSVAPDLILVV